MALILSIETSSPVCSICLAKDGKMLSLRETSEEKSHATLLTIFIDEVLKENNFTINDIDAVAVSEGPGSYTGLRIGVSSAKGICYGIDKPLIAISTLQALAKAVLSQNQQIEPTAWLCPLIDARRMEVYSAFFDISCNIKSEIEPHIIDENSFKDDLDERKIIFFGSGAEKCKSIIVSENAVFIDGIMPSSSYMIELAEEAFQNQKFVDVVYFEPFYLKEFMATTPKNKIL